MIRNHIIGLIALWLFLPSASSRILDIRDEQVKDAGNLKSLRFVSRAFVPYGPDKFTTPPQTSQDQPYRGYAYGMVSRESVLRGFVTISLYRYQRLTNVSCFDRIRPARLDTTTRIIICIALPPRDFWSFWTTSIQQARASLQVRWT